MKECVITNKQKNIRLLVAETEAAVKEDSAPLSLFFPPSPHPAFFKKKIKKIWFSLQDVFTSFLDDISVFVTAILREIFSHSVIEFSLSFLILVLSLLPVNTLLVY